MTDDTMIEIHRGVTFGFWRRRGDWETPEAMRHIERMAELNVGWVCVTPTIMMETPTEPRQFADFEVTPSDFELMDAIDRIHELGMKVHLRPMIECWDGQGRLQISFPPDRPGTRIPGLVSDKWKRWWQGMRARTRHFARLAQRANCEMYGIDSEIDSFVNKHREWREVLDVARTEFDGPVTSSHTRHVDFLKELESEDHWFRDLDVLGTSYYHRSADEHGVTVEQRMRYMEPIRETYREIARRLGKPIMFGEVGCTSSYAGGMQPWGWSGQGGYEPSEQATFLEAVLGLFWDEPWWAGMYWWKWDENNDRPQFKDDPSGDKGFEIYGKPAGDVMKQWFGRTDRSAPARGAGLSAQT